MAWSWMLLGDSRRAQRLCCAAFIHYAESSASEQLPRRAVHRLLPAALRSTLAHLA